MDLFLGMKWLLKPNGIFVFNTFAKPRWSLKPYHYEGRLYIEASAWFRGQVWHLQWCPNLGANWTRFFWHRKEHLLESLIKYFNNGVDVIETDRSLYFRCRNVTHVP